jgi:deoxyadenosine/deoxycytidine kinase
MTTTIQNHPVLISIEGNIGSGKTTLFNHLKQIHHANPKICFLDEPVKVWDSIKDEHGNTMLEKYYDNQNKYAFAFQMLAYISRLSILKEALKENYDIIITERSVYTDYEVFAKMLYDSKKIEDVEYQIYTKWFHEFLKELPPICLVYIKTEPKIAFERVKIRARKGESIELPYLEKCHQYHEKWLNTIAKTKESPLFVINANHDIRANPDILYEWVTDIEEIMYK